MADEGGMEEPTRIELVIAVLQTAPLATWVRLQEKTDLTQGTRAGNGARTRNLLLGKQTRCHYAIPAYNS